MLPIQAFMQAFKNIRNDAEKSDININIDTDYLLKIINSQDSEYLVKIKNIRKNNSALEGVTFIDTNGVDKFYAESELQDMCYQHFINLKDNLLHISFQEMSKISEEEFKYFNE